MEQRQNIHNFKGQIEGIVKRLKDSKEITEENKKEILRFKDFLSSENISISRIISYLNSTVKYAKMLGKSFTEASITDIRAIIAELNQTGLSENTKRGFKITLKRLYRFLEGMTKKGVYPEKVEWLSASVRCNHRKLPEELLTEEEILKIIQKCQNLRDKALISSLAESGCRISEIALMKIKHVSFEEYGARLTVDGKTGMRKILVINSAPYLQQFINQHPGNNDFESYLWIKTNKEVLTYARINHILRRAAKDAGIKKRVYPHLFRHSRATFLASIFSDASMKQYFGWTQGSNMASTYIHMNGKETDEAILRVSGIKINKEEKKSRLEPKKCIRCGKINEVTNRICGICGLPLEREEAENTLKVDTERQQADQIMNTLMQDKDILELIKKKLEKT